MTKKVATKKSEDVKVVEVKKDETKEPLVVKCISAFYDVQATVTRNVNDQWQVTEERLAQIQDAEKAQGIKLIEVL